jgi:hypothetical protein
MTRKEKAALRRRYQTLKDYDSQFKEVPRPVSTDILALFSQIEGPVADRPEFIALTDSGEVKHINTHNVGLITTTSYCVRQPPSRREIALRVVVNVRRSVMTA